jgi:hypothetical protein
VILQFQSCSTGTRTAISPAFGLKFNHPFSRTSGDPHFSPIDTNVP